MKNQKGITLIALVITIIIMSILVAVSVTIAMQGGLFTRAKEAKISTQYAAEKEELLVYTLGEYYNPVTGELNITGLANDPAFTNSWNIVNSTADYIEVTKKGSNSGVTYKIYKAGGVITDNYGSSSGNESNVPTTPGGSEATSEIVGEYYMFHNIDLIVNSQGTVEMYSGSQKMGEGTYTYDSTLKIGTVNYEGDESSSESSNLETIEFSFKTITENGAVINKIIIMTMVDQTEPMIAVSNGVNGLPYFTGTYVDTSDSSSYIQFGERTNTEYFPYQAVLSGSTINGGYILLDDGTINPQLADKGTIATWSVSQDFNTVYLTQDNNVRTFEKQNNS